MQFQNNADIEAAELETFFREPGNYAHAGALVLESYGAGHAWLRPSTDAAKDEDARCWPTQAGRDLVARLRAEEVLFGHPWPSAA